MTNLESKPTIGAEATAEESETLWSILGRMLESSMLTSGLIALIMVCGIMYAIICGIEVPDFMIVGFATILGFFFGARGQESQVRTAKAYAAAATAMATK